MIKININNGQSLEIQQEKNDEIKVSKTSKKGIENFFNISQSDFTMLLNYYQHVKDKNIKCDFINPYGDSRLELIKNIMDVDTDSLKGVNHYIIKGMYNKIHKNTDGTEWAEIVHKTIDEFDYTWDEIERDGGIAAINKEIKETYKIA